VFGSGLFEPQLKKKETDNFVWLHLDSVASTIYQCAVLLKDKNVVCNMANSTKHLFNTTQ